MPDPECPECEKVVLNGGVAARVLDETCHAIYSHLEAGHSLSNPKKLVVMANEIEDKVFRFQREVLEQFGFKGPWPHSLTF